MFSLMAASGDIAEGAVASELLGNGCVVLFPFGQDQAYDLVVDRGGAGFVRIQVKTGWERNGCVRFNSSSTDHGHGHRDYHGRADYFGVYLPTRCQVYVVPVPMAANRRTYLRLTPTANNQARRTRLAEDFVLERYLDALLPAPGSGPEVALAA